MDDDTTPPATTPTTPSTPQGANNGITMQRPFIVALLFLLNFVLGISAVVGVVLAYVWRKEPDTQAWEKTHYTYLIRTFWIGLAIGIAIMVLWFGSFFGMVMQLEAEQAAAGPGGAATSQPPPTGFLLWIFGAFGLFGLGMIWFLVRSVLSMAKSGSSQPMPRPETWWF